MRRKNLLKWSPTEQNGENSRAIRAENAWDTMHLPNFEYVVKTFQKALESLFSVVHIRIGDGIAVSATERATPEA